METWKIIERLKPLHVHAHCSSLAGAQHWIEHNATDYCKRRYFVDKTLTPQSFAIKCPDDSTIHHEP